MTRLLSSPTIRFAAGRTAALFHPNRSRLIRLVSLDSLQEKRTFSAVCLHQFPRKKLPNPLLQAELQVVEIGSQILLERTNRCTRVRIIGIELMTVSCVFMKETLLSCRC